MRTSSWTILYSLKRISKKILRNTKKQLNSEVTVNLLILIFSLISVLLPYFIILVLVLLFSKFKLYRVFLILLAVLYSNIFIYNLANIAIVSNDDTFIVLAKYQDHYEIYSENTNSIVDLGFSSNLEIGSRIELTGEFEYIDFNPYYSLSKNKYLSVEEDSITVLNNGLPFVLDAKNHLLENLNQNLTKESSDFAKSLLFGDSSFIDKDLKENFREIGALHILALSGYNFILILSLLESSLFFVDKRKRGLLTVAAGFIYLLIAGITNLSGLRAFIFFAINSTLNYFGTYSSKTKIILFTMLFFLILNPFNVFNFSIVLSYLAYFGITLASRIQVSGIRKIITEQVVVMLFTLPAVSLLNNSFNLLSIIFNIILTPLTSLASVLLVIGEVFSPLLKIVEFIIRLIIDLSSKFSEISLKLDFFGFLLAGITIIILMYILANLNTKWLKS